MAGFYINHPAKKDFIRSIVQEQIKSTGVNATEALMNVLAKKKVDLSYPTLLRASFGEFTKRTVVKMIQAGWFTANEYRQAQTPGTASTTSTTAVPVTSNVAADMNDEAEKQAAAFQRGLKHGVQQGIANLMTKVAEAFISGKISGKRQGYLKGVRDGQVIGRISASNEASSVPTGLQIDKMQSLFNLTTTKGAAHGEQVAARRAAGKIIQKWINEKFKINVEVDLK